MITSAPSIPITLSDTLIKLAYTQSKAVLANIRDIQLLAIGRRSNIALCFNIFHHILTC